jgi:hypothetical protein
LLNIVSFDAFHQAVHHHHHAALHSAEAEADACHRAIYHGDLSHECEHPNHVTKSETECELCKVTVFRFFYSSIVTKAPLEQSEVQFNKPASSKVFGYIFSLAFAPRGPPALS